MIRALALVVVVACSRGEAPTMAPTMRERVRAQRDAAFRSARAGVDQRIAALRAQLQAAPGDLARARTSTALDEALEAARRLGEEMLAESARIDALPDRCFVPPAPVDCKLVLPDD